MGRPRRSGATKHLQVDIPVAGAAAMKRIQESQGLTAGQAIERALAFYELVVDVGQAGRVVVSRDSAGQEAVYFSAALGLRPCAAKS